MPGKRTSHSSVPARNRLAEERYLRGWSQQYMAECIGTTPLNISRWERGLTTPSPHFSYKLCSIFGLSPGELGLQSGIADIGTQLKQEGTGMPCAPLYDSMIPLSATTLPLIGRANEMARLKSCMVAFPFGGVVALHGLPGVGKTALALELVHDPAIRKQMSGGILWAALGPSPDIQNILGRWGTLLGINAHASILADGPEGWMRALHSVIGMRKILLILDDVWRLDHALACQIGGPNCVYLLTTRFPQHALALAATSTLTISELNRAHSLELLTRLAPEAVAQEREQVSLLGQAVGGLPLALVLIGNYLRLQSHNRQPRRIQAAIQRLQQAQERLQLTVLQFPQERSSSRPGDAISLQAVIAMSDQRLGTQARTALRSLSVLPARPASFTEAAALAVCQEPVEMLDELSDAGLLESVVPGRYTLHRTIADYARLHLTSHAPIDLLIAYALRVIEQHATEYVALESECDTILAALEAAYLYQKPTELICGVLAFVPFLHAYRLSSLALHHVQHACEVACNMQAPQLDDLQHWLALLCSESSV